MDPLASYKCPEFVYQDSTLEKLQSFSTFRDEDLFTDVEIEVEHEKFRCHRIVLAAASPYYKALFQHDPHANQCAKLSHPDTTSAVFKDILEYMYTSKLTITMDNVMGVFELADFLHFRDIVHCCSKILLQNINSSSAVSIFQVADAHLCQTLAHAAKKFIKTNFQNILESQDFVNLSFDVVFELLSDQTIVIHSEEKLLRALCTWISCDIDERKHYLEKLLNFVNFDDIGQEQKVEFQTSFPFLQTFFKDLEVSKTKEDMVQDDVASDTIAEVCLPNTKRPSKCIVIVPVVRTRTPMEEYLLLYNPNRGKWSRLTKFPFDGKADLQRVTVVDNCIYITGGEIYGIPTHRVIKYDVSAETWTRCAHMNYPRYNHAATEAMGYLYVFGGDTNDLTTESDHGFTNSLERYNPSTDQWDVLVALTSDTRPSNVQPRVQERCCFAMNGNLVHLGDFLYLVGGTHTNYAWPRSRNVRRHRARTDVIGSRHSSHIKCYNLLTNTWSSLPQLARDLSSRSVSLNHGACFPYSGFLLFIEQDPRGKKMALYNPVNHKTVDFLSYQGQHRFGASVIQDDKLYAIGGCSSRGPHDLVHCTSLDATEAQWQMLDPLPFALSGYLAVSVSIKNYSERDEFDTEQGM